MGVGPDHRRDIRETLGAQLDIRGDVGSPTADRQQFERLYRANARRLLGYVLRRVEQPEDAVDVLAETMLVAWRRIDDVPPGDEARLWLYGVARRVLANHRRGAKRRDQLGERLRLDVRRLVGIAPDRLAATETNVVLTTALGRLHEDDRELLRLTTWEGCAPHEIARVLDVPAASVRTRLHRARARLRRELVAVGWTDAAGERSGPSGHVHHDGQPLVPRTEGDA